MQLRKADVPVVPSDRCVYNLPMSFSRLALSLALTAIPPTALGCHPSRPATGIEAADKAFERELIQEQLRAYIREKGPEWAKSSHIIGNVRVRFDEEIRAWARREGINFDLFAGNDARLELKIPQAGDYYSLEFSVDLCCDGPKVGSFMGRL